MSIDHSSGFTIESFDAAPDPHALGGVLFAEDFDVDEAPAAPEAVEPVARPLTEADIGAALERGYEQGRTATLQDAEHRAAQVAEGAAEALGRTLAESRELAQQLARDGAALLAREIMQAFAALLPESCAHHGAAEVKGLVGALLPMLAQQPRILIRANPHIQESLLRIVAAAGGARDRVTVIATDALAEGDVGIEWQDGMATRDATSLLRRLQTAFGPLGLGAAEPAARVPPLAEAAHDAHRVPEFADA